MKFKALVLAVAIAMTASGLVLVARPSGAAAVEVSNLEVSTSAEQLAVKGLTEGDTVELMWRRYNSESYRFVNRSQVADRFGTIQLRSVQPGNRYHLRVNGELVDLPEISVPGKSFKAPSQSLYSDQELVEGFQYIETRDGTTLSVNVVLPGPIEDGPYPTVIEYSGYDPSNPLGNSLLNGLPVEALCGTFPILCKAPAQPSSLIAGLVGYAVVGVNIRGTGCSGGSYDFFEHQQLTDGYDAVETVAAQDWVKGNKVGMVGLSYPGISQLWVARTQPPSLAAIAPMSVFSDTSSVARPGGLLNVGFATSWAEQVLNNARPSGTGWVRTVIANGDEQCAENQELRLHNVDASDRARTTLYYDQIAADLDIRTFASEIKVPAFLGSAYQDEQTGPSFGDIVTEFGSPVARYTLYNGLHADGFSPELLVEWNAFLDLYVADKVPQPSAALSLLGPVLATSIFGGNVPLPPYRWGGVTTLADARAKWEAEPQVKLLFERGGQSGGLPVSTFTAESDVWPLASTDATRLFFEAEGGLSEIAPASSGPAVSFLTDPEVGTTTYFTGGSDIWRAQPDYHWEPAAAGNQVAFETEPIEADTVLAGTASVDLWLKSTAADTDLEVILSEIDPDGNETLVQVGWLRASYRATEPESTETRPIQLGREANVGPLPAGEFEPVRVLVPTFAHAFHEGSKIRLTVNTPGGDKPEWAFELLDNDATTENIIGTGASTPSSIVLPKVDIDVPTERPDCGTLRGQPCRPAPAIDNTIVDESVSIATYSIDGYAPTPTRNTPELMPAIAEFLNGVDLALVQEDWESLSFDDQEIVLFHDLLAEGITAPYRSTPQAHPKFTNPARPLGLFADGLNRFGTLEFDAVERTTWIDCFGYGDGNADCWGTRGYSVAATSIGDAEVDVYNVHLDQGFWPKDDAARAAQLSQLVDGVTAISGDRAVIVTGSFEGAAAADFATDLGLEDVCSSCKERMFFRSGSSGTLELTEVESPKLGLSSRNPLVAHFVGLEADPSPG